VRRFWRILRNLLALGSILLGVATVAFWIRSYQVGDQLFKNRFERLPVGTYWTYYHVLVGKGAIGFNRLQQFSPSLDGSYETWVRQTEPPFHISKSAEYPDFRFGPSRKYLGVEVGHFAVHQGSRVPGRPRAEGHLITIPFWTLLVFFTLAGAPFWLIWYRNRRRRAPGLCRHCGYDLRASPDRCPECGHIRNASPAAA